MQLHAYHLPHGHIPVSGTALMNILLILLGVLISLVFYTASVS